MSAVEDSTSSSRSSVGTRVRPRLASNAAGSGLGPWYLVLAKTLSVGLSNSYFESVGLPSLVDDERYQLSNGRVRARRRRVAGVGGCRRLCRSKAF